ncbi:NapC/NirT family cytochrome c [Nevskia soli]|uniref:NapC/NirT family cytochrome c n=1 Tax=Nevskia soli TaxID=418856 RepID=UPI0015D82B33|nr:NapC/NirT family cytochrome c [Nevskia soli]
MPEHQERPLILLLTSHWVSMLGAALVTLAGFSWLFALPANIRGHAQNPYIGLLLFVAIPMVFFAGLALIPIGIILAKRRVEQEFATLPDRHAAWRRAGIFFGVMTAANVLIGSQLTYRSVEHMETVQFCGQTCHVMNPEFTAHLLAPHQQVACATCHVAPGATGWLKAKMNGTKQLMDVVFNKFPRPIEGGLESNKLVSSAATCEQCHESQVFIGPELRTITKYKDEAANTRTETVLMMQVGGGRFGGIHGAHLGPGVHIRYAAQDKTRQTIPWVEYRNIEKGVTRTYLASGAKPDVAGTLPVFEMQCADCHNRAAHSFEAPDRAVDNAITTGRIAPDLPFVKKTGVELIKVNYQTDEDARQKIPSSLANFYQQKYPDIAAKRASDVQAAGNALLAIYQHNVFPDLKVTWGTYPNNLGHTDNPGCFRCHDDSHATADKKTITQDCSACHQSLAMDEASPEILKTLGVAETSTGVRQ